MKYKQDIEEFVRGEVLNFVEKSHPESRPLSQYHCPQNQLTETRKLGRLCQLEKIKRENV